MKVTLTENACIVTKEKTDKKYKQYHRSSWALAESTFLYHVMQELKKQGHDLIKKRMHKDGNLCDDDQQYIRHRNLDEGFVVYNSNYSMYDAGLEFNLLPVGESLQLDLLK